MTERVKGDRGQASSLGDCAERPGQVLGVVPRAVLSGEDEHAVRPGAPRLGAPQAGAGGGPEALLLPLERRRWSDGSCSSWPAFHDPVADAYPCAGHRERNPANSPPPQAGGGRQQLERAQPVRLGCLHEGSQVVGAPYAAFGPGRAWRVGEVAMIRASSAQRTASPNVLPIVT